MSPANENIANLIFRKYPLIEKGSLLMVLLQRHLEIPYVEHQDERDVTLKKNLFWLEYPTVLEGTLLRSVVADVDADAFGDDAMDLCFEFEDKRGYRFSLRESQIENGYILKNYNIPTTIQLLLEPKVFK